MTKSELISRRLDRKIAADGKGLLEDQGRGADVILATSNSYKAVADSIKGIRPLDSYESISNKRTSYTFYRPAFSRVLIQT